MFKQLSKLCVAVAFVAIPLSVGCAGRPAPPEPEMDAAEKELGEGDETTVETEHGERQANDGAHPID